MTMSIFIYVPLQVKIEIVKRIYAYLDKMSNVGIQLWTYDTD